MAYAEPECCPLCGGPADHPERIDPELIECENHGRMHVAIDRHEEE